MISETHAAILAARGIEAEHARSLGVRSVADATELPEECPDYWTADNGFLPGLIVPWRAMDGRVEWQIRPDVPPVDAAGRAVKYATRSVEDGYAPTLWLAKIGTQDGPRLLIEGTCQTMAVSAYAPAEAWVYGMVGCRGWMSQGRPVVDLHHLTGTEVVVALDADVETNIEVWLSGELLQRALRGEGATSIKWVKLPASRKTGIDDLLGGRSASTRAQYLARLVDQAVVEKFPKSRAPRKATGEASPYFNEEGLKTKTLSDAVLERYPALLTAEGEVAVYRDGVYGIDPDAYASVVVELLGERFRSAHLTTAHAFTAATLYGRGARLPEQMTEPMVNFTNGMLDLRTGELVAHDPSFMSTVRIPWSYDADATCPTYERWIKEAAPGQVEDIEESASMMLDPSLTPTKALFLFGPSRSGKSTFLRLMRAVASSRYTSSVTLHQLAEDRFAAAQVYGMILNVAADLSSADVEDVSIFKLMTGDDAINANRKYGRQFSFVNRALFAFSANDPPTVGERSKAYLERIRPFAFPNSFAGAEDPAIESEMMREIPGIIARWVRAYREFLARGSRLVTTEEVAEVFARVSDRVRLFVHEACELVPAIEGATVARGQMSTPSEVTDQFKRWAESIGGRGLGRNKLTARLSDISGVYAVRDSNGVRGLNIIPKQDGDSWQLVTAKTAGPAVLNDLEKVSGSRVNTNSDTDISEELPDPAVPAVPPAVLLISSSPGGDTSPAVPAVFNNEIAGTSKSRVGDQLGFKIPNTAQGRRETAGTAGGAGPVLGALLPDRKMPDCPQCGNQWQPVPPAGLWYACPVCYPATFAEES